MRIATILLATILALATTTHAATQLTDPSGMVFHDAAGNNTITGEELTNQSASGTFATDVITEKTADAGVTVEGVVIKDSRVVTSSVVCGDSSLYDSNSSIIDAEISELSGSGGGSIILPTGDCYFTTIHLRDNVSIEGQGKDLTNVFQDSSSNDHLFVCRDNAECSKNIGVKHLSAHPSGTMYGLLVQNVTDSSVISISNVVVDDTHWYFTGQVPSAILIQGVDGVLFINSTLEYSGTHALRFYISKHITVKNNKFLNSNAASISFDCTEPYTITDVIVENNYSYNAYNVGYNFGGIAAHDKFLGCVDGLVLIGNESEKDDWGFSVQARNASVVGNYVHDSRHEVCSCAGFIFHSENIVADSNIAEDVHNGFDFGTSDHVLLTNNIVSHTNSFCYELNGSQNLILNGNSGYDCNLWNLGGAKHVDAGISVHGNGAYGPAAKNITIANNIIESGRRLLVDSTVAFAPGDQIYECTAVGTPGDANAVVERVEDGKLLVYKVSGEFNNGNNISVDSGCATLDAGLTSDLVYTSDYGIYVNQESENVTITGNNIIDVNVLPIRSDSVNFVAAGNSPEEKLATISPVITIPVETSHIESDRANDPTTTGTYTGSGTIHYVVEMDSTTTFMWSDDGGATWDGTGVIYSANVPVLLNNGVYFTLHSSEYVVGSRWEFIATNDSIVINNIDYLFTVSGSEISIINNIYTNPVIEKDGMIVTLMFDGEYSITDNGNILLSAQYDTVAGDFLMVMYKDGQWIEVSRSDIFESVAGVSSFNTRTGDVVPVSGDYTHSQITDDEPNQHIDWTAATNDLSTTGTGYFGGPVGIGNSATPTYKLQVSATGSTTGSPRAIYGSYYYTVSDASAYPTAFQGTAFFGESGGTQPWLRAFGSTIQAEAGSTITNAYSFGGKVAAQYSDSVITNGYTIMAHPPTSNGSIGSMHQVHISGNNQGTGTIGNFYGLYLENIYGGSTNWSIYSAGGTSWHAGEFRFGGSSDIPSAVISSDGNLQAKSASVTFTTDTTATALQASGTFQRTTAAVAHTITEPTLSAANDGINFTFQLAAAPSGNVTLSSGSTFYIDGINSGTDIVNTSHALLDEVACHAGYDGTDYIYLCRTVEGTWN